MLTALKSVAHLWASGVRAFGDKFEANDCVAVRTLSTDRLNVEDFILIGFEPHELKAFRAATDLR